MDDFIHFVYDYKKRFLAGGCIFFALIGAIPVLQNWNAVPCALWAIVVIGLSMTALLMTFISLESYWAALGDMVNYLFMCLTCFVFTIIVSAQAAKDRTAFAETGRPEHQAAFNSNLCVAIFYLIVAIISGLAAGVSAFDFYLNHTVGSGSTSKGPVDKSRRTGPPAVITFDLEAAQTEEIFKRATTIYKPDPAAPKPAPLKFRDVQKEVQRSPSYTPPPEYTRSPTIKRPATPSYVRSPTTKTLVRTHTTKSSKAAPSSLGSTISTSTGDYPETYFPPVREAPPPTRGAGNYPGKAAPTLYSNNTPSSTPGTSLTREAAESLTRNTAIPSLARNPPSSRNGAPYSAYRHPPSPSYQPAMTTRMVPPLRTAESPGLTYQPPPFLPVTARRHSAPTR